MPTEIAADDALSHVSGLLADAPAHVRERWREVEAYLQGTSSGEPEIPVADEDDLLDRVAVTAKMFSGATRRMEIDMEFPFDIRSWFDGRSRFEFEPESPGRSEDDRMLDFYRRQEAERRRLTALIRSSVAPIAFDCLRRLVGRDMRRGEDDALYGLRHAVWLAGDRSGPKPYPAGGEPDRIIAMIDGAVTERTA
jgi:hypothetical protein